MDRIEELARAMRAALLDDAPRADLIAIWGELETLLPIPDIAAEGDQ